ncbi:MAG TPA: diphosphate--fructose-6-phosphate 1-phosphotransferase [bacterium]|nr:diphosphate--fructose-6-phosphate 1-phosphotransferase [bacterium]HQI47389.1 diphosphate--fructose-6-phosphate 1-phosphotransferase [bacterium]HQJ63009.1 diphosphate--fructose-6-phosphate 1-phosphotransferase [bacterium]
MQGNIGILVGGGPAPGLNGVIAAVTIEARRHNLNVYGIMDGYKWLVKGDETEFREHVKELRISDVSRIHYDGGSILRTSRTNPAKSPNGIENSVKLLKKLGITYMVTIGGDDTAYGAMEIARAAGGQIKFAHVPKTIDNDLPLPNNLPTFGYQTARDLGATLVKNLMEDARTMDRWYITVAMGRHAGHLALGIAKSAGATIAIIAEEFETPGFVPLDHICDIVETAVIKRRAMGSRHGVIVIAEGVAERLSPEELKQIPGVIVEYDAFGNILHSEIELGKIIKLKVESRFAARGDKMSMVEINIGYVLRCADPIPFDQEYTRDLGFQAVRYLLNDGNSYKGNAMISVDNGKLHPIPFDEIIDKATQKTAVRYVDIHSDSYRVARSYMVRLEKRDLEDKEFLAKLAAAARMTPKQFIERFAYLI